MESAAEHGTPQGRQPSAYERLPRSELEALADAAREVRACQRVLAKTGDTLVGELLRGHGTVYEWRHYPPGDVYDAEYHAQYYYHCHPEGERPSDEHGHFHTFLRAFGMPAGVAPLPLPDFRRPAAENDVLSHLIGIAMDHMGRPIRLFTVNRWVTGEVWFPAADVVRMLDCFVIDHARPSWPVNRWITAMMRLFRADIAALLHERDAALAAWAESHPGTYAYEDRGLEILSQRTIDVDGTVARVEAALLGSRPRRSFLPEAPLAEATMPDL